MDAPEHHLTVAEASRLIRTRKLSPVEYVDLLAQRITQIDPQIHAFIAPTIDHARRQAAIAEREIMAGQYRSPMHGIPYGAKDIFETAGIATTGGSRTTRNHIPEHDAAIVSRLAAAGALPPPPPNPPVLTGVDTPLAAAEAAAEAAVDAAAAASLAAAAASFFPATLSAQITLPSAKRLLLIAPVSRSMPPAEPLSLRRSEPARSTKMALPYLRTAGLAAAKPPMPMPIPMLLLLPWRSREASAAARSPSSSPPPPSPAVDSFPPRPLHFPPFPEPPFSPPLPPLPLATSGAGTQSTCRVNIACDLDDCALSACPPVLRAAVAARRAARAAAGVAQETSLSPGAWNPLSASHLSCRGAAAPAEEAAAVEAREGQDCEEEEEFPGVVGGGGGASRS